MEPVRLNPVGTLAKTHRYQCNICHILSPSWKCHTNVAPMLAQQGSNAMSVLTKPHWCSPSQ